MCQQFMKATRTIFFARPLRSGVTTDLPVPHEHRMTWQAAQLTKAMPSAWLRALVP